MMENSLGAHRWKKFYSFTDYKANFNLPPISDVFSTRVLEHFQESMIGTTPLNLPSTFVELGAGLHPVLSEILQLYSLSGLVKATIQDIGYDEVMQNNIRQDFANISDVGGQIEVTDSPLAALDVPDEPFNLIFSSLASYVPQAALKRLLKHPSLKSVAFLNGSDVGNANISDLYDDDRFLSSIDIYRVINDAGFELVESIISLHPAYEYRSSPVFAALAVRPETDEEAQWIKQHFRPRTVVEHKHGGRTHSL